MSCCSVVGRHCRSVNMKHLVKLWIGVAGLAAIGILMVVLAQRERADFQQQIQSQIQSQSPAKSPIIEETVRGTDGVFSPADNGDS